MLDAVDIVNLTKMSELPIQNYKDCLNAIVCNLPKPACYLNKCESCPGTEKFSIFLSKLLTEKDVTEILFSIWQSTDRATLRKEHLVVDDFIEELCTKLINLKTHHFVATEQSAFLKNLRSNLKAGEVLVQLDFSENYAFLVQDAAQVFHYNNDQCTVHPIVYYYSTEDKVIQHQSIILLSDSLTHDTDAVFLSQQLLIDHIKKRCKAEKIYYFTNGAKQHYKNRFNMANLLHHEEDFGVQAEWHFHATAHGKGPCDGVGATLKRGATRASLQAPAHRAILTPQALLKWCKQNLSNIDIYFYTKQEHERVKRRLQHRFTEAKSIPDIQKSNSFTPLPGKKLLIKTYSDSVEGVTFPRTK